jgi:hypothetical protein
MYNVRLFRIVTINPLLNNENMLIKMGKKIKHLYGIQCLYEKS